MTLDVIKNMISLDAYFFDSPKGIRCIDDRDDRQTRDPIDTLPDIAIPGAGLGIILGVFGGLNLMEKRGINHNISRDLAYRCSYDVTGGMPFHSDEKRMADSNPCAGCGHFALALKENERYLLSSSDLDFFNRTILPSLAEKNKERVLYCGDHQAKAVAILESARLGLPSLLSNKDRVYVYSKFGHHALIDEVSYKIYQATQGEKTIDRISMRGFFEKASEIQLGLTVKKLASDLPILSARINERGDVVVTADK